LNTGSQNSYIFNEKKKSKIKINQAHIPYSVPENLVFYQVQNPASFIVWHLFISYEVARKKLSVCPSSSLCLLSQDSPIYKVFIHNYSYPFLSYFLQRIHRNILITVYFSGGFQLYWMPSYSLVAVLQWPWLEPLSQFAGFVLKRMPQGSTRTLRIPRGPERSQHFCSQPRKLN